jgi:chaperone required for assembly of F1-ATPase
VKRFYQTVGVVACATGFGVALDGKPILTPRKAPLALPTQALAEAVAAEWEAQLEEIRPDTMVLLKLANTALDRVASGRDEVIRTLAGYGDSDVVCYHADEPAELVGRQEARWQPLRDWIRRRHGVELSATSGIVHTAQQAGALAKLGRLVAAYDDFALAALAELTTISGSIVIALALGEGEVDAETAWAAAFVDELHQAERWGEDEEATERRQRLRAELEVALRFLELSRA